MGSFFYWYVLCTCFVAGLTSATLKDFKGIGLWTKLLIFVAILSFWPLLATYSSVKTLVGAD